jgi:hypothetical protein
MPNSPLKTAGWDRGADRASNDADVYQVSSALAAATLLTASIALFAEPASTAPFSGALAIKKAAASDVETVRWGGGGWGGRGWGGGLV